MNVEVLLQYIQRLDYRIALIDAPLMNNFSQMSKSRYADLRKVFERTILKVEPENSVVSMSSCP